MAHGRRNPARTACLSDGRNLAVRKPRICGIACPQLTGAGPARESLVTAAEDEPRDLLRLLVEREVAGSGNREEAYVGTVLELRSCRPR